MKNILYLLLFLITPFSLLAQKKSFDQVFSVDLNSITYIMNNNEISGYVMFYKVDKIDKTTNSYLLKLLNANLEELVSIGIEESNATSLVEAFYDGNTVMLKLCDATNNIVKYYTYDKTGNLVSQQSYTPEPNSASYMVMMHNQTNVRTTTTNFLHVLDDKGYVDYYPSLSGSSMIYNIRFQSKDGTQQWKYTSTITKGSSTAEYIGTLNNDIYSLVTEQTSILSPKTIMMYVECINIHTGKLSHRIAIDNSEHKHFLINKFSENGLIKLFGTYFDPEVSLTKAEGKGIFYIAIDSSGTVIENKHIPWAEITDKYITNDPKNNKNVPSIAVHNIFTLADGKIYLVGEEYWYGETKEGSKTGSILGDIVIMEFDSLFHLTNTKLAGKKDRWVGEGSGNLIRNIIYTRLYGNFSYSYTQFNKTKTDFFITYKDRTIDKDDQSTWSVGFIIKAANEDYAFDKLDLITNDKNVKILPAKPGHFVILEYFETEKRLSLRLEKMNY